jgi:hypothetical protein
MDRLQAAGTPLPASLREVRVLIPWAVEFRYGETIEDLLEREQAVALAEEIIVWARDQIEAPARTQPMRSGDRESGIVRVPSRSKPLFPAERTLLAVVLRGVSLHEVRWTRVSDPIVSGRVFLVLARTQPLDSLRARRCTSRRSTVVCGWTDHPAPNRSSWSFRIRGHGDFENFPALSVRFC